MAQPPRFFGLIPAAGRSTRMGRPKLLLPFAGATVLEHVVLTLRESGAEPIVVVSGPHPPELPSLAEAAGAIAISVPSSTPDMRTSVQHGLRYLQRRHSPQPADAFLLAPADHPGFSAALVRRLCEAYLAVGRQPIVVPVHARRRGHPAVIAWKHVPRILTMPRDCGINSYLRQHPHEVLEIETDESGILINLNCPDDYVALQHLDNLPRR